MTLSLSRASRGIASAIQLEAFHAPCCEGAVGPSNEIRLASLFREVQRQLPVAITIHTLVFGDPESLQAVRRLTEYLRASGLVRIADGGIFGILRALPVISVNGIVRFVNAVPGEAELLACLTQIETTWRETEPGDTMEEEEHGSHHRDA